MAKIHHYEETDEDGEKDYTDVFEFEDKQAAMLARCLESIGDLMDEHALNRGTVLSIQQQHEMDEIIKDARVQGLLS